MRYLVKVSGNRIVSYVPIFKDMKLERRGNRIRVVYPEKGVWFTGYKLVQAKTPEEAVRKALGREVTKRKTTSKKVRQKVSKRRKLHIRNKRKLK